MPWLNISLNQAILKKLSLFKKEQLNYFRKKVIQKISLIIKNI